MSYLHMWWPHFSTTYLSVPKLWSPASEFKVDPFGQVQRYNTHMCIEWRKFATWILNSCYKSTSVVHILTKGSRETGLIPDRGIVNRVRGRVLRACSSRYKSKLENPFLTLAKLEFADCHERLEPGNRTDRLVAGAHEIIHQALSQEVTLYLHTPNDSPLSYDK